MTTQEKYNEKKNERETAMEEALKTIMETLEGKFELKKKDKKSIKRMLKKTVETLVSEVAPKLKIPKPEHKPKGVASSFLLFSNAKRSEVRELFPDLKNTEITKKLGVMWKELSDEDKKEYVEENKTLKAQHEKDVKKWKKDFPEEVDTDESNKSSKSSKSSSKRAPTIYHVFLSHNKGLSKAEKSQRWKELKEQANKKDKKEYLKYQSKAEELKKEFKKPEEEPEVEVKSEPEDEYEEDVLEEEDTYVYKLATEVGNSEEIKAMDLDFDYIIEVIEVELADGTIEDTKTYTPKKLGRDKKKIIKILLTPVEEAT